MNIDLREREKESKNEKKGGKGMRKEKIKEKNSLAGYINDI